MAIKLEEQVNFHGTDWIAIRAYLMEQDDNKVALLLGAKTHDETNELRGAVKFIRHLLSIEKTAKTAVNQRTY
jgi:hypothetical protein